MDIERLLKIGEELDAVMTPDSFEPAPPPEIIDGEVRLGVVRKTNDPFGINLAELGEHTLITGRAGAGKTSLIYIMLFHLIKYGVPFWAFDFKQDYRHLARLPGVLVFDWKTFLFNPLRPPTGVDPKLWMQSFTNVFCQVYWLLSGSKGIILQHIDQLYQDYGVYDGGDVFPSMHDLYDSLKRHKLDRKYGREAGFLESAQNRVNECLLSFGHILNWDKGFLPEELLSKNVVLELEGLLAENQAFLLTILLRYVFQYRITSQHRGGLRHIMLFDEAKTVYSKKREFSKELGISEIANFTSTIREFGEGLIVADQMPTELGDSIKANVYTVISMSQSGAPNISEMSRTLGLTKEQVEVSRSLQADKVHGIFEAIVKLNGRWMTPFVMQVFPVQITKDVSHKEIESIMAPALEQLRKQITQRTDYTYVLEARRKTQEEKERQAKAQKPEPSKTEKAEPFEDNLLIKILTNIREHPFIDQKTRIQMLGLPSSTSTTNKLFKELVNRELVTIQRIGLGRGRSSMVFYEITDKGKEFASMEKVIIPGKGSFKHKYWQHQIKKFYENLGYLPEIEKRYGNKNVDVGFEIDGKRMAIEVELSPDHLIENIQKDFDAGCSRVVIAVPSKRSIGAYKKEIKKYDPELIDNVEFKVLSAFV